MPKRRRKVTRKPLTQVQKNNAKKEDNFTFELGSPAKGTDPPTVQSTPNDVVGDVTEQDDGTAAFTSMDSTPASNKSDDIVLPHPSPRTSIHISVDSSCEHLSPVNGNSHVSTVM